MANAPLTRNSVSIRAWAKWAALAVAVTAGAAFIYRHPPAESSVYPPCLFHWLTGLHCPGCGSGRASYALLHGDVPGALDLNPFMVVALPLVTYAVVRMAAFELTGRRLPGVFLRAGWIWTLFWAIVIFWVLRNIPYPPFSYLAP